MGDGSRLAADVDCGLHGVYRQGGERASEGDCQELFSFGHAVDATNLVIKKGSESGQWVNSMIKPDQGRQ